jgi:5,5'-dehydrodivanillate O-demethylase
MTTREDNELMTRIGPGTPAGDLLRRYWHPICPVIDLSEKTPKLRVRMLGEDLVLYRDLSGRVGLVRENCAHRRASLYYGFVEEDGIRCAYHGWKFDADGKCIEQPFEKSNPKLKDEVCQGGFKVERLAGLYWGYLGPQPAPLLPRWEVLVGKRGPRIVELTPVLNCNWLQVMENSVDSTHTYYLHGQMMVKHGFPDRAAYYTRPLENYLFEIVKHAAWAGVSKVREWGGADGEKELGHPLIFPLAVLVPARTDHVLHFRVPIDDTHTRVFRVRYSPGADTTGVDWDNPPVEEGPRYRGPDGEYDLTSFPAQDAMAWETAGVIHDRSQEFLGASDRGIVLYRRMLREQIAAVQAGKEPLGVIRDPEINKEIRIDVSEGQAKMARKQQTAAE